MAQHGSGELRTTFGSAADVIVEQAFLERTRVHPGVLHTKTRRVYRLLSISLAARRTMPRGPTMIHV